MKAKPTDAPASKRDQHLFGAGPKRILSIDGGGVRGIIAVAFLERLEVLLAQAQGAPVRLCDHFDLIGGTSTGAIIATSLALGYSAKDIRQFYLAMGPRVFHKPWPRLPMWQAKFNAAALRREIDAIVGGRTLDSEDLQTGLALILKRLDKGGAWILSNNPRGRFWDTPPGGAFIGNRHYQLGALVRASAAAPHFFDLEPIEIVHGEATGLFVDGGLTAHNDPSVALLLMALLPGFGLQWPTGEAHLSITSLGTGTFRPTLSPKALMRASSLSIALTSLKQQIAESQQQALTLMCWLGRGGAPWPINSEIGDLGDFIAPFGPLFRFHRYDVRLEREWLTKTLNMDLDEREIEKLRHFDNPDAMPKLDEIARRAAERFLSADALAVS